MSYTQSFIYSKEANSYISSHFAHWNDFFHPEAVVEKMEHISCD